MAKAPEFVDDIGHRKEASKVARLCRHRQIDFTQEIIQTRCKNLPGFAQAAVSREHRHILHVIFSHGEVFREVLGDVAQPLGLLLGEGFASRLAAGG